MTIGPGDTVGDYVVEQPLGRGGVGEVFLARGPRGERVALKLLRAGAVDHDAASNERFEREGDMLRRLDHPNIVRLQGRGVDAGRPWLAMEFVPGRDLATLLRERVGNKLPAGEALFLLEGCARALEAAHAQGIIHRDVKPGNVLVTRDGKVKLTDFGIALSKDVTSRLTARGEVVGTPTYVAPEVLKNGEWGPAADMYTLGILAYRLLTGAPAFPYKDISQLIAAHLREPAPPLSNACPELAAPVAGLFQRLLAKEPATRPTARQFLSELEKGARDEDTRKISPALLEAAQREHARPINPPSGEGPPLLDLPTRPIKSSSREGQRPSPSGRMPAVARTAPEEEEPQGGLPIGLLVGLVAGFSLLLAGAALLWRFLG